MVMRLSVVFGVIAVAVAGCSTAPVEEPDNTPTRPTAVTETHVTSDGIMGFLPYDSTQIQYLRVDRRRAESTLKGTGTFSGFLVGTNRQAQITRLDSGVVWTLNPEKKEYSECPLKGCAAPAPVAARSGQPPSQPQMAHESDCAMKIANTSFTVKPTGHKRTINDFSAEQYQIAWRVTLKDPHGRTSTSNLNVDLWTTPLTPAMQQALGVEQTYQRAFAAKTAAAAPSAQIVPPEVTSMISGYLFGALNPAQRASFFAAGKQLEKIKGHPISTRTEWGFSGNACAPKESTSGSSSGSTSGSSSADLVSGVAGLFGQGKADPGTTGGESKPILAFLIEVKSLRIQPAHDSVFTVPGDYKKTNPH